MKTIKTALSLVALWISATALAGPINLDIAADKPGAPINNSSDILASYNGSSANLNPAAVALYSPMDFLMLSISSDKGGSSSVTEMGTMVDLGGYYGTNDGNSTGFMSAVAGIPEPGSLALLGMGMIAMGLIRKRNNQ